MFSFSRSGGALAFVPSVGGTFAAHMVVHAALFGTYETTKDVMTKSIREWEHSYHNRQLSVKHHNNINNHSQNHSNHNHSTSHNSNHNTNTNNSSNNTTKNTNSTSTNTSSTSSSSSSSDDDDEELLSFDTHRGRTLAVEAAVVFVSGTVAGVTGEVVQHYTQPLEELLRGQSLKQAFKDVSSRLGAPLRMGVSVRGLVGAGVSSGIGFLAYELGRRF
jgi:hypothetical protein